MSVRKRTWTSKGEERTAWTVDYLNGTGTRRLKTFSKKKDADNFSATANVEVRQGVHVADSASIPIKKAEALWLESAEAAELEATTIAQYRQHIVPLIGRTLVSKLSVPAVREFEDALRAEGRSPAMVRKVRASLGAMLADMQERGLASAVRETSKSRRRGKERQLERRHKGKLKVGVDIPSREEIKAVVGRPIWTLATASAHGDLFGPSGLGTSRTTLVGRRSGGDANSRSPARGRLQRNRGAEV